MKLVLKVNILIFIIVLVAVLSIEKSYILSSYKRFYVESLRGQLASILLAMSAFLFALKTFIVINMFDKVYSDKDYQIKFVETNPNDLTGIYKSLNNLNDFLLSAIWLSIITSMYHLCFGGIESNFILKFGILLFLHSVTIFGCCVYYYQKNLRIWLTNIQNKWNEQGLKETQGLLKKKKDAEKEELLSGLNDDKDIDDESKCES